jgi:hypothetical protein
MDNIEKIDFLNSEPFDIDSIQNGVLTFKMSLIQRARMSTIARNSKDERYLKYKLYKLLYDTPFELATLVRPLTEEYIDKNIVDYVYDTLEKVDNPTDLWLGMNEYLLETSLASNTYSIDLLRSAFAKYVQYLSTIDSISLGYFLINILKNNKFKDFHDISLIASKDLSRRIEEGSEEYKITNPYKLAKEWAEQYSKLYVLDDTYENLLKKLERDAFMIVYDILFEKTDILSYDYKKALEEVPKAAKKDCTSVKKLEYNYFIRLEYKGKGSRRTYYFSTRDEASKFKDKLVNKNIKNIEISFYSREKVDLNTRLTNSVDEFTNFKICIVDKKTRRVINSLTFIDRNLGIDFIKSLAYNENREYIMSKEDIFKEN